MTLPSIHMIFWMSGNEKATPTVRIAYCRSRFLRVNTVPLCPSHGYKEVVSFPIGLLTYVSDGSLSAFSGSSPNDWLSSTAGHLDTYSAGSAGTHTPFSFQPGSHPTSCPATGNHDSVKKTVMRCYNTKNITITILKVTFWRYSRFPDLRLKR